MQYPQVLLLGNGINQAFNGGSWDDMLKAITTRKDLPLKLSSPMPLRAELVSEGNLDKQLKSPGFQKQWFGGLVSEEQKRFLQAVLNVPADEFLTTNYSYELEAAALGCDCPAKKQIQKMADHTAQVKRCESQYRFYTYNYLPQGQRVWHIHGEARSPGSMVLGHYFYGNNVAIMRSYLANRGKSYRRRENSGRRKEIKSWLDAFILGDVYVLGFGFNLAEFDLWWLLNRKKREQATHGKVYFYEPRNSGFDEKIELLKLMDVETIDCGIAKDTNGNCNYKKFYHKALNDIMFKINHAKNEENNHVKICN